MVRRSRHVGNRMAFVVSRNACSGEQVDNKRKGRHSLEMVAIQTGERYHSKKSQHQVADRNVGILPCFVWRSVALPAGGHARCLSSYMLYQHNDRIRKYQSSPATPTGNATAQRQRGAAMLPENGHVQNASHAHVQPGTVIQAFSSGAGQGGGGWGRWVGGGGGGGRWGGGAGGGRRSDAPNP